MHIIKTKQQSHDTFLCFEGLVIHAKIKVCVTQNKLTKQIRARKVPVGDCALVLRQKKNNTTKFPRRCTHGVKYFK